MAAGAESRASRVDERPLAFYQELGKALATGAALLGLLFR
jgi:hypothetical protein